MKHTSTFGSTSQAGTVLPLVAVAAMTVILLLALALDSGQLYLARTQLQNAADSAARAALRAAYNPAQTNAGQARLAGVQAATQVLAGNTVIDGGVRLEANDLRYGLYNFDRRSFTAEAQGFTPPSRPSAVRVQVQRTDAGGHPIQGLFTSLSVRAESIASVRCRQIALALDLSASMLDVIPTEQSGLRSLLPLLERGAQADMLALVSFDADGTTLAQAGRVETRLQAVTASSESTFRGDIGALRSCPHALTPCLGTNTAAGLALARAQLESTAPVCNGDRLIVVVSDGVPCDPSSATGTAALIDQSTAEVDRAAQEGISVSSIYVFHSGGGLFSSCPTASPATGTEDDPTFMASLVRGPQGQSFSNVQGASLEQLLALAIGSFPVVIVH
jgi:hypothetical protein